MSNDNTLLPCPFCGNDKNIAMANERHDHSGGYFISCPECLASTGLRYASGDDPHPLLVEQWNRRAALAAPAPQPSMSREVHTAVRMAYGHLWHVNNEPMAPVPLYSPEKASYEARKHLRDLLTAKERGRAINEVGALIGRFDAAQNCGEPESQAPSAAPGNDDDLRAAATRVITAFESLGVSRSVIDDITRRRDCEAAMLALKAALKGLA